MAPRKSSESTKKTSAKRKTTPAKKKERTKYISQAGIYMTYGLNRKDLDRYFPAPVLRTNSYYSTAAPTRLWDVKVVEKLMKKPPLAEKYQAFLVKQEEKMKREKTLHDLLEQFTPESLFSRARLLNRHFVLHVGPTNSGKTYHALQALRTAQRGVYLGPLRLLALEMFDTLNEDGIACNLLTGEEREDIPGAQITASTIELCDYSKNYDVAVIDEAQLITDSSRGSRWMQAICLVNADEIHICLAPESEDLICSILREIDAPFEVFHHDRLVPLQYSGTIFSGHKIQPGDAVIAFSRKRVLGIAAELEGLGLPCSVIYGALPPAARREQVRRFASGETCVVVATDAIGMGISLPIRRVIFSEESKYNGFDNAILTPSEIKQIAGRAGRFGKYDLGEVLSMSKSGIIPHGLNSETPKSGTMRIPFPKNTLNSDFSVKELLTCWNALPNTESYAHENVSDALLLLEELGRISKSINKTLLYDLITCPVDVKSSELVRYWRQCALAILHQQEVPRPYFYTGTLEHCELQYKAFDIYHQLMRRIGIEEDCQQEKEALCLKINEFLSRNKSNYLRTCRICGHPLPMNYSFGICKKCYRSAEDYEAELFGNP